MQFLEIDLIKSALMQSSEKRAKFYGKTVKEYLHYLWNDPTQGQNPYRMFGGVMRPNGFDENGDIIYIYDETKTFMNGFSEFSGITKHGFYDIIER